MLIFLCSDLTLLSLCQTCLRESDNSNEEDSLSTHSEDRLSEGSWDRVERKDTEVSLVSVSHLSNRFCLHTHSLTPSSPHLHVFEHTLF